MTLQTVSEATTAVPARPGRGLRTFFIVVVAVVGVCEALSTTGWITWNGVPDALALPISMIGFAAFIVLVGPFGNAAAALGLVLLARRRWRWPWWRCLAMAAPFAYVAWQLVPKPW